MSPSPPPEILVVIEVTARSVAQVGLEFEKVILEINHRIEYSPFKPPGDKIVLEVERSGFLKSADHPYHEFYRKKRDAYLAQCQAGMIHFRAPMFYDVKPPPNRDDPPPPPLFKNHPPEGITLVELGLIKVTAQFVARYGKEFWNALIDMYMFPHFRFLKCSDENFSYYQGLVVMYQRVLSPLHVGLDTDEALGEFFRYLQLEKLHENVGDLHALVYGLDCMDNDAFPHVVPSFSLCMFHAGLDEGYFQPECVVDAGLDEDYFQPECVVDAEAEAEAEADDTIPAYMFPVRIPLKELGIIKLTALFVARYGKNFLRALMMREVLNPHFDFLFFRWDSWPHYPSMEPAEIWSHVFNVTVYAYSNVIMPSKLANNVDYHWEDVVGYFFQSLQLEKLEEGVKAAMIDLHAFVAGVDYLAHIHEPYYSGIMSPPQRLSALIKNLQPTLQTHPGILVLLPMGRKTSDYPPLSSKSQCDLLENAFSPGIRPDELGVIKLTAQFVTMYGMSFLEALMKIAPTTEIDFLNLTHIRRKLFLGFVDVYYCILKTSTKVVKSGDHMAKAIELFFRCLQLNKVKNGVGTSVMELYAFMSGLEYFTCMDVTGYSAIMAGPERRSVMMNRLTQMDTGGGGLESLTLRTPLSFPSTFDGSVSPLEIGIIKLTAVFVARYGVRICKGLMKKVDMRPVLKFMEPSDECFHLYKVAVDAYSKVVNDSDDVDTETVVERYFQCLEMKDDLGDLYGFLEGIDLFAQMEDEKFSKEMGNHLVVHLYQYDETISLEPGRQKVDESASTLLEGTSRIKVCVPTVDGRKVIEIIVESWLLEKVASLKEKIAKMIQMQANELKLRRKSGRVLKEDKSLAHNDVEAGEILTLTWRISRWN
ncbi:unnamed protein product [Eruca vesicaria subsp. sativa]|uniref:Ubiquitin-like domain-containing protein n=1 Tax=Eruca vesicaria subsp. sativa TaxID=29727 RepID=A0ABC8J451_ERUVS|nr:unnamed protein product [Eruca vesicaria subsp. sativa]